MLASVSFWDMSPGDALVAEIRKTCKGRSLSCSLEIANQLAHYNDMYDENLTFGEFVEAYHPTLKYLAKKKSE